MHVYANLFAVGTVQRFVSCNLGCMKILHELQQLALRVELLQRDAALSDYADNKSAYRRAKREVRALSKDFKELYKQMLCEEVQDATDRKTEVCEVPQFATGDTASFSAEQSAEHDEKAGGREGD